MLVYFPRQKGCAGNQAGDAAFYLAGLLSKQGTKRLLQVPDTLFFLGRRKSYPQTQKPGFRARNRVVVGRVSCNQLLNDVPPGIYLDIRELIGKQFFGDLTHQAIRTVERAERSGKDALRDERQHLKAVLCSFNANPVPGHSRKNLDILG